MQKFDYRVMDREGRISNAKAAAASRQDLVEDLQARGYTILSMQPAADSRSVSVPAEPSDPARSSRAVRLPLARRLGRDELTLFTRQLATTLSAGLPLLRILHSLHRRCTSAVLRRILEDVAQELQRGRRFSDALATHGGSFDEMYLNLIRVGETGGTLPETVGRLASLLESEGEMRRRIQGAMIYPAFVLTFSVLMSYALLVFLMPMFIPTFQSSGLDLQRDYPLTWHLMRASEVVRNPTMFVSLLLGAGLLMVGLRFSLRFEPVRRTWDTLRLNLPVLARLSETAVAARFCRALATLCRSGVPLLQSLSLVADSAGNVVVASSIRRAAHEIQGGASLSDTLDGVGVFPDLMIQMITIGEEAGTLPEMLERTADYYEREMEGSMQRLAALLEPATMLFIGCLVGIFVMAIILPILGVSTAAQNQL